MKVLSLFDGISCGRVALERAGIPVETYYASEIDKYAIQITQKNYPDTIQLGDVTQIDFTQFAGKIDLVMGGSPCQDLSNYKHWRHDVKGLDGSKSNLFYQFVRAIKEISPKYFLLENVASMQDKWRDIISQELGVKPILFNSADICGAERKRLYWTNIKNIRPLEKRNVVIKDIIEPAESVPEKYWYNLPFIFNGEGKKVIATLHTMNNHRHAKEVYNPLGKCNTLLCDGKGGNLVKKVFQDGRCRKLTPVEYERLQTLPDGYTDGVADSHRYTAIGNGWTVDIIAHIFNGLKG